MRPSFAYLRPATVAEACRLLTAHPGAAVLAGGTDLMVHLRQPWRGRRPPAVVSLRSVAELTGVEVHRDRLRIGAAVTLGALMAHPEVERGWPVLPFAVRFMGSPAIRGMATVGGNLANASPAADLPPVLLALDASVEVAGPAGTRRLPIGELFRGPGRTVLQGGEILTWIEVPRTPAWRVRYERLDVRRAMDIAMAAVAVAIRTGPDGAVAEARVALGAVAPTPRRSRAAEAALTGRRLERDAIAAAAAAAMAEAHPIDDVRASAGYRREMVEVLARRGLSAIAGEGTRGDGLSGGPRG